MNNNTIYNTNSENLIGYRNDLKRELISQMNSFIENEQWEEIRDLCEILLDLDTTWVDETSLLTISENNGMGWTVRKYNSEQDD